MKAKSLLTVICLVVLVLGVFGCAPSAAQIQVAIAETQTAAPTITPTPTETPIPPTPTPIATPTPTGIPGITFPITASEGTTFLFTQAGISDSWDLSGKTYTPDSGYQILGLTGTYTGDMESLFSTSGAFYTQSSGTGGMFYVTGASGVQAEWGLDYYDSGTITILFAVPYGEIAPFTLHDDVDGWTVNITTLLNQ